MGSIPTAAILKDLYSYIIFDMGKYAYPVFHRGGGFGYVYSRRDAKKHVGYDSVLYGFPNQGVHTVGNGGWTSYNGIDFRGKPYKGNPNNCTWVLATVSGHIGKGKRAPKLSDYGTSAGRQLYLNGKDQSLWFYTHIDPIVKAGQWVARGQCIGYVYNYTNNIPHLHIAKKGSGNAGLSDSSTFLVFS